MLTFFSLCDFAWQSDVTLRLLIVQKCNNKKTWVFVFFRICFCLSMCKIIFFSCFVVISNVFTRFINNSVSLRIEPLTVQNCSPWYGLKSLKKMLISELYISFPQKKGLNKVIRRLLTFRTWMLTLAFNILKCVYLRTKAMKKLTRKLIEEDSSQCLKILS